MANCKTAVSILQEHCARLGMTPIYSTISQEGLSHQPKFTISCTAGPTVGTGGFMLHVHVIHQSSYSHSPTYPYQC